MKPQLMLAEGSAGLLGAGWTRPVPPPSVATVANWRSPTENQIRAESRALGMLKLKVEP